MRPLIAGLSIGRGTRGASVAAGCLTVALVLLVLAMQGVARVSAWMLPILWRSAGVMLAVLLILLLAALPRRSRPRAALALTLHALLLGMIVWLYALLFTLETWGWIAVIAGVALFGIGILPIAILAALVTSAWTVLLFIATGLLVAAGTRVAARACRASLLPRETPREIQAEYTIHD